MPTAKAIKIHVFVAPAMSLNPVVKTQASTDTSITLLLEGAVDPRARSFYDFHRYVDGIFSTLIILHI